MLPMILSTVDLIPTFKEWSYTQWGRQTSRLFYYRVTCYRASLVAQMVKNLPSIQETRVRSLCWEDPLEKNMATHSSLLAWRIPWTRSLAGYSPWSHKESDMTAQLTFTCYNIIIWVLLFGDSLNGTSSKRRYLTYPPCLMFIPNSIMIIFKVNNTL